MPDDQKIIQQILFGTEKMTLTHSKTTFCKIKFSFNVCKNLSRKYIDSLRETAITFFHFKQAFGNKVKLRNFVNIWMVEDGVQDLDSTTCSIFQLYFYNNLFNPDENSKIQSKARLIKKMIETLLN